MGQKSRTCDKLFVTKTENSTLERPRPLYIYIFPYQIHSSFLCITLLGEWQSARFSGSRPLLLCEFREMAGIDGELARVRVWSMGYGARRVARVWAT